jgi:hypothetical protein
MITLMSCAARNGERRAVETEVKKSRAARGVRKLERVVSRSARGRMQNMSV